MTKPKSPIFETLYHTIEVLHSKYKWLVPLLVEHHTQEQMMLTMDTSSAATTYGSSTQNQHRGWNFENRDEKSEKLLPELLRIHSNS